MGTETITNTYFLDEMRISVFSEDTLELKVRIEGFDLDNVSDSEIEFTSIQN